MSRYRPTPAIAAHACPMCGHGWELHHPADGCLVKRCGCWRTQPPRHPD